MIKGKNEPAIEEQKHIQQIFFQNEAINRLHILSKQKGKTKETNIILTNGQKTTNLNKFTFVIEILKSKTC